MPEPKRRYPRINRVNEVLREIVAEELERLADVDSRIGFLTVTAVVAEPDLRRAKVLLASLSEDAKEALMEQRVPLQAAIGRQVRLKRTPQLSFQEDPAIATGNRIEDLLRTIPRDRWDDDGGAPDADADPAAGDDVAGGGPGQA